MDISDAWPAHECAALQGPQEVCHGSLYEERQNVPVCVQVRDLLHLRKRLIGLLLLPRLPEVIPGAEWMQLTAVAEADRRMRGGTDLSTISCNPGPVRLHFAFALICAGILEQEKGIMDGSYSADANVLINASRVLLRRFFQCPWRSISDSGWPVFTLLARLAQRRAASSWDVRYSSCPSDGIVFAALVEPMAIGFRGPLFGSSGLLLPRMGLHPVVERGSTKVRIRLHLDHAARSAAFYENSYCLWEAADRLGLPDDPICVAALPASVTASALTAKDCNRQWPACGLRAQSEGWLHFYMQPPRRRDIAADKIRDEQRPFCSVNEPPHSLFAQHVRDAVHNLEATRRRLNFVEVGAHFGDCTLLAFRATLQHDLDFKATIFEANPDVIPTLHANLILNGAANVVRLREAMVLGKKDGPRNFLSVPPSSVHAAADLASNAGSRLFQVERVYEVDATTLDAEMHLLGSTIDILLINVNSHDLNVLSGAKDLFSNHVVHLVLARTNEPKHFVSMLEDLGYVAYVSPNSGTDYMVIARLHPNLLKRDGSTQA